MTGPVGTADDSLHPTSATHINVLFLSNVSNNESSLRPQPFLGRMGGDVGRRGPSASLNIPGPPRRKIKLQIKFRDVQMEYLL